MKEIVNRKNFLSKLTKEEAEAGYIKFNIPPEHPASYPEGVWGWVTAPDKERYMCNTFDGCLTAILCNEPLNYNGVLFYGSEVVIRCNGKYRAELDPKWIQEYLSA